MQFVLAKLADSASSDLQELALLANHKSVGITILGVAFVRIAWRLANPPPPLPQSMPRWQITASHASHWALYALLFLLPISGWLMSSATAYSVSWFNLFPLPDLIAPNAERAELLEEVHELLGYALLALASLHIAAALKHHYFDKDSVLSRIVSATSFATFVVVIAVGTSWLGSPGGGSTTTPGSLDSTQSGAGEQLDVSSELPAWQIDYTTSFIRFTGDQAGAAFDGDWESWQATLQFSEDDLGVSAFSVSIDTSSANTQDVDRDTTLADPEWFDTVNYPEATFRADRFSATESGYVADGQLVIKNVASPVRLMFDVERDGARRVLTGTAHMDRIVLGVGTGEWEDTEWVGQFVSVEVLVNATVAQ